MFGYLKKHPDMGRLVHDAKAPTVDKTVFNGTADWKDFQGEVEEESPQNVLEP